jgi:alpha-beta hydrolase superfamily lysophospholipase
MNSRKQVPSTRRRGVAALLGVTAVALGIVLVMRPFATLNALVWLVAGAAIVTGVQRWRSQQAATATVDRAVASAWILIGIAALAWPGITVRALAWLVGAGMLVGGVGDLVRGLRGSTDERIAALLRGGASIVLGVVALAWPDVTLLVVAIVFGARTVIFGLSELADAVRWGRGSDDDGAAPGEAGGRGRLRRFAHATTMAAALVVALGLAAVSAQLRQGEPVVDDFYAAPSQVPEQPGSLLRAETFQRGIPDGALAWRVLYTTTRDEGTPAVASALVVAPEGGSDGPRDVIAWAHGTTGIDETCAPSVAEDPFGSGAFFALDRVLEQDWVLVATDYVGLGTEGPHPYLIGEGQARSVLDAVRAARQLDDLALSERTVVWGHSQGGNAALWTGIRETDYAPDVGVVGVAALAPASDLVALAAGLETLPGGSIFATYMLDAYAAAYEDVRVEDYVEAGARVTFDELARRCLAEPAVFPSVLTSLSLGWSSFTSELAQGALGERLVQNTPSGEIRAPLLLGQGEADPLVLPDVQAAYVRARCEAGQLVDYRTYADRDHVGVVATDSPLITELLDWTRDRLDGVPPEDSCPDG